ncbi:MAG TPA: HAMP domain-containing sensor histidine kinase [Thermoleophilia bacterium]|nr:HAMP domain-containing sensor histidine kinase [Thermoleophilia bacterium]
MQEQDTSGHAPQVVALVGAGEAGRATLAAFLDLPGIEVRYYFDVDPAAAGVALAREHGVRCRTDGRFDDLADDADVDLVVETTGDPDVRAALAAGKHPESQLLAPAGAHIITQLAARLVEPRNEVRDEVREDRAALLERQAADERRIAELSEALARVRSEEAAYIRQAAHQVKSPLAAIQTYVNVILGGYTGELPERTRETVQKIHDRCEAALAGLAKRRALADLRCGGRDGLEMSAAHLNELASQAVERHAALAERRGVALSFRALEGDDLVRCDAQTTVLLLSELVENAVVYSREGGLVEVAVGAAADGALEVRVRDHGIGIPERCLPRIFDEDYRGAPAVQHHPDGSGLGLTIAREIADLQGFGLAVTSEEGQGSEFTLTMPAARAA